MLEIDVVLEPADEIEQQILDIFDERGVEDGEQDDLRPLLRDVLTNWTDIPQYYQELVLYTITYVANEMPDWRSFLTDTSIRTFFTAGSVENFAAAAERLSHDAVVGEHALITQFLPFIGEQFISIYDHP